jgi:hypothetical protein
MTVNDLITLAENKLAALNQRRTTAHQLGDTSDMPKIDAEIVDTETTLSSLRAIAPA